MPGGPVGPGRVALREENRLPPGGRRYMISGWVGRRSAWSGQTGTFSISVPGPSGPLRPLIDRS